MERSNGQLPSDAPARHRERSARAKVLVLGFDSRSFLGVVRSLGRRGLEVHVAWCPAEALAAGSKFVSVNHDISEPECLEGPWLTDFVAFLERESFDWVVPTNDPSVVALQLLGERWAHSTRLQRLNPRAFEVAYDKHLTHRVATQLEIPVPDERVVSCIVEVDAGALLDELGTPLVLKPRRSFAFGRRKWEHQVRKATTRQEVETSLRALLEQGEVLVQRNVLGRGVGVEVLASHGEVRLAFQHERLHEPLQGGGSSYRRSQALDPELLEATERLCTDLEYDGVGMFEYKRDDSSGRWWLIEINARFWGSLPLALFAGVDFPWALYCQSAGIDSGCARNYSIGVTCRNLSIDWPWVLRNLRADHGDPTLATVPITKLLGEAWRCLTLRDHIDTFTLDDPRPGLAEIRAVLRDITRILAKKMTGLPYRVAPLRSLLTAGLRRDAAGAANVLFVCKGNICRSPFAEHYARKVLPNHVEIDSSGTYPYDDRSSPAEAVEAACALGVELSAHRSTILSAEQMQRADVVLVFDEANLHRVQFLFPEDQDKVYRLGAIAPGGSVELHDPYGGNLDAFSDSYGQIAAAVEIVAELMAARLPGTIEEAGS